MNLKILSSLLATVSHSYSLCIISLFDKTDLSREFLKDFKKINHENKIYESKFPMSDPILADFGDG